MAYIHFVPHYQFLPALQNCNVNFERENYAKMAYENRGFSNEQGVPAEIPLSQHAKWNANFGTPVFCMAGPPKPDRKSSLRAGSLETRADPTPPFFHHHLCFPAGANLPLRKDVFDRGDMGGFVKYLRCQTYEYEIKA